MAEAVRDLAWYKQRLSWTNFALVCALLLAAAGWMRDAW